MTTMTREAAEKELSKIFGIAHFYDEQWIAIDKILRGERVLMIERTGFGKSLCYQFPATQFSGITVIFSPLIALMRDQVKQLKEKGISADYINSEQTEEENHSVIQAALEGKIKILYIAPERQENKEWIEATRSMNLSMIVIDEAHTISTWGHDFRPSFRRIINLVQLLPANLPILATTATATIRVQHDIEQQIGGKLTTIRGDLSRPNLLLYVIRVHSEDEKLLWLGSNMNKLPGTGLIYTGTRIDTEIYSKWLRFLGIEAIDYNAGHDADTRKMTENGLMQNKWKCIVSTNALGMGIDKPDIRFIIHTQMPQSPIHYYQEIGRSGRDGQPSYIILFFNETLNKDNNRQEDCRLPLSFIEHDRPSIKKYNKVIELLQEEPLGIREISKKANLKSNQITTIKADLIEQGIIKEVIYDKYKKYEYQFDAPALNTDVFEEVRQAKLKDLEAMVQYVYTTKPRMEYLCHFLDSKENIVYHNCDNTDLSKLTVETDEEMIAKLEAYRDNYYPILAMAETTKKQRTPIAVTTPWPGQINVYRKKTLFATFADMQYNINIFPSEEQAVTHEIIETHLHNASRLTDGYACSYYGSTSTGAAIHNSKYENGGDFPDFLLKKALSLFRKKYADIAFDLILYVPPTVSGNLVKNFASKFASIVHIPISDGLQKKRNTAEQKMFLNIYNKRDNVQNAFNIDPELVKDKTILLIDDIYDSGSTLAEIGKTLTQCGAKWIVPLVIAKTSGGTI